MKKMRDLREIAFKKFLDELEMRDQFVGLKRKIFKGKPLKTLDKLHINLLELSLRYIFQKGIRDGIQTA